MIRVVFTSSVGKESVVFVALLCVWPMIIEATRRSGKDDVPALFPWVREKEMCLQSRHSSRTQGA